ncbi:hypothetical protein BHE74_00040274 [Ensete ventricosum]|nr:hypothetical protein BHE74_00040274 [Ensete ventricosum]
MLQSPSPIATNSSHQHRPNCSQIESAIPVTENSRGKNDAPNPSPSEAGSLPVPLPKKAKKVSSCGFWSFLIKLETKLAGFFSKVAIIEFDAAAVHCKDTTPNGKGKAHDRAANIISV